MCVIVFCLTILSTANVIYEILFRWRIYCNGSFRQKLDKLEKEQQEFENLLRMV